MSRELLPYDVIASFYDEAWITDVLFPVKSGKEATVYCCRAHPSRGMRYIALKLYKDMQSRGFRNDAVYQEGRFRRETRVVRAMRTKTDKGRAFQFSFWLGHEYETLTRLYNAGANVPRPLAAGENGILMQYLGDAESPAPPLHGVFLMPDEAERLFASAMRNVELMLASDLVHGDLSAYNMLYWQGKLTIIDFPQAVDPRFNGNALMLLQRDIANLCRYFARCGVQADPARLAADLWSRFVNSDL